MFPAKSFYAQEETFVNIVSTTFASDCLETILETPTTFSPDCLEMILNRNLLLNFFQ